MWPEVEGINPSELLNDGWQIRRWNDVPAGWPTATLAADGEIRNGYAICVSPDSFFLVFCRPPESNTGHGADGETSANSDNGSVTMADERPLDQSENIPSASAESV